VSWKVDCDICGAPGPIQLHYLGDYDVCFDCLKEFEAWVRMLKILKRAEKEAETEE
jgi:hypothetical protein